MNNEEYELLPHKILKDLEYDVESLKKKLSEPDTTIQELMSEIADLKEDLKEMHNIFKVALQDIKEEDSAKLLAAVENKIETVTTQNETIARGMIAISDKLEDFMKQQQQGLSSKPTISRPLGPPPESVSRVVPPPPGPPLPPGIPPPPGMMSPEKSKRKGIFH